MHVTGFHFQRGDADHIPLGIANQIQRHPFDEKIGAGLDVLLVQRMQHGVTGAVRSGAGALNGFFAMVAGVSTERALVNRAVGVAVEGHAEVFEFINHLGRFTAHELDRVLVTQPVASLDGVVKVKIPVVLVHVGQ